MKRIIAAFSLLFLFFQLCVLNVSALEAQYHTEPISDTELNEITKRIDLLFIEEEVKPRYLSCFDVSEEEMIATGTNYMLSKDIITVYDSNGVYQYGYSFGGDEEFYPVWFDKILNLYLPRSAVFLALDNKGNCINAQKVISDDYQNNKNNMYLFNPHSVQQNDNRYYMKNGNTVFETGYSYLVKEGKNEEPVIIIDCFHSNVLITVVKVLLFLLFIFVVLLVGIKFLIRYRRKKVQSNTV